MNKTHQRSLMPIVTNDMRMLMDYLKKHDGLPWRELDGCWPVWTDRVNHRHWTSGKTRAVLRQCLDAGMVVADDSCGWTEYRVADNERF
jgi:hypothetical protein